jgi:transcriptional regulator with XRE-family HTH domain
MDKEDKMTIARNLARIRMERGISQEELAGRINSSASHVSQMENATRGIGAKTMPKICSALGITPNDLYGTPDTEALTDYELEVIRVMNQLPEDEQEKFVKMVHSAFLEHLKKKREQV